MATSAAETPQPADTGTRLRRIAIASATALLSVNVWTGGPLLAVWVGSQVQGNYTSLGMLSVFVVMLVLIAVEAVLLWFLAVANNRYDELIGRPPLRRRYPWLQSMRGERAEVIAQRQGVTGVERIVVVSAVLAVIALEFWFFFLAGSSLPSS